MKAIDIFLGGGEGLQISNTPFYNQTLTTLFFFLIGDFLCHTLDSNWAQYLRGKSKMSSRVRAAATSGWELRKTHMFSSSTLLNEQLFLQDPAICVLIKYSK